MPLVVTLIFFAHLMSGGLATVHGAATHDRMTSSSTSVGVGPSPLDGMIAGSINAKAARTSFSGFGTLDTGSAAVGEKSRAW